MLILFPHDPISPEKPDADFAGEYFAALRQGFSAGLYHHEMLEAGDAYEALAGVPSVDHAPHRLLLRGWMLSGERYAELYSGLCQMGYFPEVSPAAYEEAHYFPLAYPHLEGSTARTGWISGDDPAEAWTLYQSFSRSDAIIKDWVKSAKHRWSDGCFLPAGTDAERFGEIFRTFRQARGDLFNRGVVIKEFLPLMSSGTDMRGFPLTDETRLFFWRGKLIVRPLESSTPCALDSLAEWESLARKFKSPFITIDVAPLTDGTWKVIEVGDAGVSGLPTGIAPEQFYARLWEELYGPVVPEADEVAG